MRKFPFYYVYVVQFLPHFVDTEPLTIILSKLLPQPTFSN
jgi:hypothetical protein